MKKTITKTIAYACLLVGINLNTYAQVYTISASTGTYAEIANGTDIDGGTPWDDQTFKDTDIGFTFNFYGKNATKIAVLNFGFADQVNTRDVFDVTGSFNSVDQGVADGSSIAKSPRTYSLTGQAGSRIFKLQYKNASFSGAPTDYINYQVWLYETSNKIEVHIGNCSVTHQAINYQGKSGPHIGVVIFGDDQFQTVNYSCIGSGNPASPTKGVWSTGPPTLSGVPVNGQIYTFTPGASGIIAKDFVSGVNIYPNPSSSSFTIDLKPGLINTNSQINFVMYDVLGNEVKKLKIENQKTKIEKENFPRGVYFYKMTNGGESMSEGKLVVQ